MNKEQYEKRIKVLELEIKKLNQKLGRPKLIDLEDLRKLQKSGYTQKECSKLLDVSIGTIKNNWIQEKYRYTFYLNSEKYYYYIKIGNINEITNKMKELICTDKDNLHFYSFDFNFLKKITNKFGKKYYFEIIPNENLGNYGLFIRLN